MAGLKPLVLIVDDSPATVEILGQVLGKDNRIEQAVDGAEALQRVQSGEKPDLILLDVVMAGMDGYEVCERLRANPHTQDIPVIFLTVREEAQDQERGFAAGGVDYIAKPIEPLVVCARVRTQIRLKQRAELLESLVSVDALTGVPNRKAFDHYLETEWKRASRGHYPLALLILDVDCFKEFNENQGHEAGDDCLRKIAHSLRGSLLRPQDFLARYDGGAFAAILPVCDVQGACKVGEQLRVAVEALNIPNPRSSFAEHVTISIGLAASIPCQEDSPLALAEWADKSLHQAKRSGRNKVGRGSTPCGDISLASLATAEEPAVKKPTLLIVDDSPSELEFVAECLGPEFTILVAPDGQKALEVVAHRMPDLVLLDVVMPGMDGYEVCRRFKADPRLESIPIIFLTVLDQAIPEAQGLALGAVDYISKPANPELIQLRVRTHLRIKQLYERECALVKLLRTSLADVTELQGLLPMCAWCQKVRNDQGYWEGLAAYISNHTGTTWTHGICPDCQYKLLHDPTA